jgi:hypothetical protein
MDVLELGLAPFFPEFACYHGNRSKNTDTDRERLNTVSLPEGCYTLSVTRHAEMTVVGKSRSNMLHVWNSQGKCVTSIPSSYQSRLELHYLTYLWICACKGCIL